MRRILALAALFAAFALLAPGPDRASAQSPELRGRVWAGCELFETFGTPARVEPGRGPLDEIYTGGNGFRDRIGAISASHPGVPGWNGGRWHVNLLKSTVDPDKYAEACRFEDLDPADFESTGTYFQCPLIPHRGR